MRALASRERVYRIRPWDCMSCRGSWPGSLRRFAGSTFSESPRCRGPTGCPASPACSSSWRVSTLRRTVRRLHVVGTVLIVLGIAACSPGLRVCATGGARLVSPVSDSGTVRRPEVFEDSNRLSGRAPRAKAPALLRPSPSLDGGPLVRSWHGVRILPQRVGRRVSAGCTRPPLLRFDRADGTLVLHCLAGKTLATLLEDPALRSRSERGPSNWRSPLPSSMPGTTHARDG